MDFLIDTLDVVAAFGIVLVMVWVLFPDQPDECSCRHPGTPRFHRDCLDAHLRARAAPRESGHASPLQPSAANTSASPTFAATPAFSDDRAALARIAANARAEVAD